MWAQYSGRPNRKEKENRMSEVYVISHWTRCFSAILGPIIMKHAKSRPSLHVQESGPVQYTAPNRKMKKKHMSEVYVISQRSRDFGAVSRRMPPRVTPTPKWKNDPIIMK